MITRRQGPERSPLPDQPRGEPAVLALAFALGVQTMVLELALPRLLAPAFGNTLFCWTAAIGLVLAALAAGYHLGGVLSARQPGAGAGRLRGFALASCAWVAAVGAWGERFVGTLAGLGMATGPLVGALALAVPPALLSAAVLPLAVGRTAGSAESGRSTGRLYALSTVGSVVGALATGYLLLPWLGVSGSLYAAAALVLLPLVAGGRALLGGLGLAGLALLAATGAGPAGEGVLWDRSNGYHRLRVMTARQDPRVRLLYLDSTLEGAVLLGTDNPGLPYQRQGVQVARAVASLRRAFFLGGGSFSMPRFLKARFPAAEIEVAEVDPDVVTAAREFLELSPHLRVHVGDARRALRRSTETYDLILGDAFHGLRAIPFHLVTREFHDLVAARLAPGGVYAINTMGHPTRSRLVASVTRTLRASFRHVHHFGSAAGGVENVWVLASRFPLTLGVSAPDDPPHARVLTDDHAPVEFLVAMDLAVP